MVVLIDVLVNGPPNGCRILGISVGELRENFDAEASDSTKHPSRYARNILEYCCFRALALSTQVVGYLEDKRFRRLTFDMMLAWEFPAASSQPFINVCFNCSIQPLAFMSRWSTYLYYCQKA